MNTHSAREKQCSHLPSLGATGVSSGLATGMILTRVSRKSLEESSALELTCFWLYFCIVVINFYWDAS